MREITVNSETYLLLDDIPEFSRGIKFDLLCLDDVVDGITRIEERTSLGGFRVKASQVIEIQGNAAVAAANSFLANLEDGKVALPLWGFAQDGGTLYQEPAFTPAYAMLVEDHGSTFISTGTWAIYGTPQPGKLKVPLVFGRIEKIRSRSETGSRLTLQVDFIEDAPPSLGLTYQGNGSEFPAGLTTSKGSQKLMPFTPDWGSQTTGAAQVEVISKEIGFRKESSRAYYSQQPIMPLGFRHYFQDAFQASELVAFFMHHQGRVKGFWTPTWAPCIHAPQAVLGGTSVIILDEDPTSYFPDQKICIIRSRDQIITREISSITPVGGSWWMTLTEALPWTLNPSDVICPAAFARWKSPRLSLRFRANGQASGTLNLVTLPTEKEDAIPTGETADTYGDQAARVIAYRFAERDPEDGNLVPNADFSSQPSDLENILLDGAPGSTFLASGGVDGKGAVQLVDGAWIFMVGMDLPAGTELEVELVMKSTGTSNFFFQVSSPAASQLFTETGWAENSFRKYRRTVTTAVLAQGFSLHCSGGNPLVVDSIKIRKAPVNTWHFTSHESDLVDVDDPGVTWESQPMDHGGTSQVLNMDTSTLSLESRTFPGNPLGIFSNFDIQHEVEVEVIEGILVGGEFQAARVIFLGSIDSVDFDGAFIRAKASSVGTLFNRKVPSMMVQKTCNWALFSTPCGVLKSAHTWTGTMDVADGESVITVTWGWTMAASHLKGGWIEIQTASRIVRATILDNTATTDLGGGSYESTLTLTQPVTAAQDAQVTAYPGCDGHHDTCATKFSNFENFGGFPFTPANNPTMLKVSKNVTSGGKK